MRAQRTLAATVLATLATMGLAACSQDSADSSAASDTAMTEMAPDTGADVGVDSDSSVTASLADTTYAQRSTTGNGGSKAASSPATTIQDARIIRTGAVALRSDDVDRARFEVLEILDAHGGTVTSDETQTDRDGNGRTVRMVLRIPSKDFDDAVEEFSGVAILKSASTNSEDVTQEWIDVKSRLAVQRASIKRVTLLLARATSIRDIVSIESELSQRQAKLDSLEQRMRYLADQTSMSTVTVSIARTEDDPVPVVEEDRTTGFIGGLQRGWDALKTAVVSIGAVVGWLLPFAVVAGLGLVLVRLAWQPVAAWVRRTKGVAAP